MEKKKRKMLYFPLKKKISFYLSKHKVEQFTSENRLKTLQIKKNQQIVQNVIDRSELKFKRSGENCSKIGGNNENWCKLYCAFNSFV